MRAPGESLTYGELDRESNRIASRLRMMGVQRRDIVSVLLPRSPRMIASFLGILKAGAAYLPLDPKDPPARLEMLRREAGSRVVISQRGAAEPDEALVPEEWEGQDDLGDSAIQTGPDDPAYVMFTSGSTGTPKGVEVPQRALLRLLVDNDFADFGPGSIWLQHSPASFDASNLEIWGPLLCGGQCVLFPGESADIDLLARFIREHRVTSLWLTSSLFNTIVEHAPSTLEGVLHVLTGGEAVSAAHVRLAQQKLPGLRLTNGYGPTENTTFTTCYDVPRPFPPSFRSVPIGQPVSGTTLHLLGEDLRPVDDGDAGEICIGGERLALGYRNRPELTGAVFIPDPFAHATGSRLYRTGDLARRMPDGNLDFVGRRDDQVKVRGYRIELSEVESVLQSHPAVSAAAVTAAGEDAASRILVAFLVRRTEVPEGELRAFMAGTLPGYMVPGRFVWIDELPLTPNGKLDRRRLEATLANEMPATGQIAPAPGLEEDLARLMASVLRIPTIGVRDSFFDCGGQSLLAMQLLLRIRQDFKAVIPFVDFYRTPTVAGLAGLVAAADRGGPSLPPIRRREAGEPPVLSFAQERLWIADRLETGLHYVIPWAIELCGALDVKALWRSIQSIVARHAPLRTVFGSVSGQPFSTTMAPGPIHLEIRTTREDSWREDVHAQALHAIDLEKGPVVRAILFRIAEDRHVLLMLFHHIAFDAWSLGVFRSELSACYAAWCANREPDLPDLPVDYADYAAWQRETWRGSARRSALDDPPEVLNLAAAQRRPDYPSHRGRREPVSLDAAFCERLRELGRQRNATIYMVLLAGYILLLFRYSRQTDIVVGTPVANRNAPGIQGMIGFFVNTLAVRARFLADHGFGELLAVVREAVLDAFSHADIPFEKLVEAHNPARSTTHAPLFQAMFILQNAPAGELELSGVQAVEQEIHNDSAMFDVTMSLEDSGGGMRGFLEHTADLFTSENGPELVRHFSNLLEAAIASPDRRIAELDMLDSDERALLLELGRGAAAPCPDTDLPTLFAERAAADPDAPALIDGDCVWTYRQLQKRAGAIAAALRRLEVQHEEPVAISLERSFDSTAALLGILQAGAAYVPLDLSYPAERLSAVLGQSGARVAITRRGAEPAARSTATALYIDEIEDGGGPVPATPSDGSRLAYLLFTSGSTGRPKGVAGEHRAVINRLRWMWRCYPFGPGERCCLKTALGFVDSVWETFGPLLAGTPSVIISDVALRDARALVATLARHRVTRIVLVPSLLRALLDVYPDLSGRLPDLWCWTCSGETLAPDLAERFLEAMPGRTLLNLYGSSEVCGDVTWHEVRKHDPGGSVPIGRAIDNTELMVLDEDLQLLPRGHSGELYVSGAPLARGYWRDPSLNGQSFLFHGSDRRFRTRDRVRWRADGALEFLGRTDNQTKIRGHRIELDEINAELRRCAGVRDAAAIIRPGAADQVQLAAFVVPDGRAAGPLDTVAIKGALRERLPEVMVPTLILEIPALPLLPNGKVDKLALTVYEGAPPEASDRRGPRSVVEAQLCEIWSELLGLPQVWPSEDFFELGGNSLLAIRLSSRIEETFSQILPASAIFETPTVEELAGRIQQAPAGGASVIVPIQRKGRRAPLFCLHGVDGSVLTYLQLARALGPDQPVYGIQAAGIDGRRPYHASIDPMLREYAAEMRRVQPEGPYRLCGFSFGGLFAFALACELMRQGQVVSFLGLLDASGRDLLRIRSRAEYLRWFAERTFQITSAMWRGNGRRRSLLRSQWNYQWPRLKALVWRLARAPQVGEAAFVDDRSKLYYVLQRAIHGFRAPVYRGSAVLFRASEQHLYVNEPEDLSWTRLVDGDLRILSVPGDHNSMAASPNVNCLAEAMRPLLATHDRAELYYDGSQPPSGRSGGSTQAVDALR